MYATLVGMQPLLACKLYVWRPLCILFEALCYLSIPLENRLFLPINECSPVNCLPVVGDERRDQGLFTKLKGADKRAMAYLSMFHCTKLKVVYCSRNAILRRLDNGCDMGLASGH